MRGLMMDFQLTIPALLRRAEQLFPEQEIVSRLPDRSLARSTYGEFCSNAKRLAVGLADAGLGRGDRVATLAWNHQRHLEAYFGVPTGGGVVHTLNPRLPVEELRFIVEHAGDRLLLVDESLLPVAGQLADLVERVVVFERDYESLLGDESRFDWPELDENEAAGMCYTSGTTGQPKGVLYSHRAIVLHTLAGALPDALDIRGTDSVLPVVPLFHANAWGLPFKATMVGAKQIFPGPFLDPESLLDLLQAERVTITGGVPTIWLGIIQALDREPERWDLSALRTMMVGGSAAPRSLIEAFDRHGLRIVHAWGMTEMTPVGTVSRSEKIEQRAKQGTPVPFVEIRARSGDELVPWDGETMGELEVRGPWVAASYYGDADPERWTDDDWFKTGDIVTIGPGGWIEIQDRSKDVIKSGGEWISSVALENALMGHPAVLEAAVIAVRHERWLERPLAVVVLKEDAKATAEELLGFLGEQFPRWQLPDAVEFVEAIPRTAAGKFQKRALRERFAGYVLSD